MEITQAGAVGTETGKENLQSAGDVLIDSLFITKGEQDIDLKNFTVSLDLFEDLFSKTLFAELQVADAVGLIGSLPIVGGEFVTFSFRTPTAPIAISRTMVVAGVKDRVLDERQQVYTLTLISPEATIDNAIRVSRSFKGRTDIVLQEIFTDYLASPRHIRDPKKTPSDLTILGSPHRTSIQMVSPYWTPFKIMDWISARAISGSGNAPNTLVFETNKGFYATSIEDLIRIQRDSGILYGEYFFGQTSIRDASAGNFSYLLPPIDRQFSLIQTISFPEGFDWIKVQDNGYFAGTLVTHDVTTKRYREYTWDYFANFSKYGHTESYRRSPTGILKDLGSAHPTFPALAVRTPNSYRGFRSKHFGMFGKDWDNGVEGWAVQRHSLLQDLSYTRFEISVPGRTDIEAGKLIFIHVPRGTNSSPVLSENFDPLLTGVYLVTSIRHHITLTGKHTMTLEVAKDSFRTQV